MHFYLAATFARDVPGPGIKLGSPALQADSLSVELPRKLLGLGVHFKEGSHDWQLVLTFGWRLLSHSPGPLLSVALQQNSLDCFT